jgi:predicted lipoprotein
MAVDATPQLTTVFIPTSPIRADQAVLESPVQEVRAERGHRDDLEALGLLLGVLSILLALAVGLGVTPGF